jgi:RNA polymerase sigma factor (sigma-70 family)
MLPITMAYDPVTTLQAVAHDREALGLFVAHEQPELLAWLERVLRDHDLAQESVQETWLILSRGEWRFAARSADAAGDVRAWLRQIALRVAFRQRQRQHSQQQHLYGWLRLNNSGAETPTPLERLVERDRHDLLWAAVAELPATLRDAIELRFRDGLDFSAVGRAQNCTALTARVRTWRALTRIRKALLGLGILVFPSRLMAQLSSGIIGEQLSLGLAERIGLFAGNAVAYFNASTYSLKGKAAITTAASGAIAIAIGFSWWMSAGNSFVNTKESTDLINRSTSIATPENKKPWLIIKQDVSDPFPEVQFKPGEEIPENAKKIRTEIQIFYPDTLSLPSNAHCPTLLSASELKHFLLQLSTLGDVQEHTTIMTVSGQSGLMQSTQQYAFIKGYEELAGELDPVLDVLDYGNTYRVNAVAEEKGIRILQANIFKISPIEITQQQTTEVTGKQGRQNYPWEEPIVALSQSAHLPDHGVLIPTGGALLIPAPTGTIQRQTPSKNLTTPNEKHHTWWALITPTVVEAASTESDPEQPNANS